MTEKRSLEEIVDAAVTEEEYAKIRVYPIVFYAVCYTAEARDKVLNALSNFTNTIYKDGKAGVYNAGVKAADVPVDHMNVNGEEMLCAKILIGKKELVTEEEWQRYVASFKKPEDEKNDG